MLRFIGLVLALGCLGANAFAAPRVEVLLTQQRAEQAGVRLEGPRGLALDTAGNLYIAGYFSDNVLKLTPDGRLSQSIGPEGDGRGHRLDAPRNVAVDAKGNVYTAGEWSMNAFRIAPDGKIAQLVDELGDGQGHRLRRPVWVSVDSRGNLFVAGQNSNNVLRVGPEGKIAQVIDVSGDGQQAMQRPTGMTTDPDGNLYVAAAKTANVFRVTPQGAIRLLLDRSGDGQGNPIVFVNSIARDSAGNLVAAGNDSSNAMRIDPQGGIREILPPDFEGRPRGGCSAVAAGPNGDFFVARLGHDGVFRIQPDGSVTRVLDAAGAGPEAPLYVARGLAVDAHNRVYVAGFGSQNVFRVTLGAEAAAPAAPAR